MEKEGLCPSILGTEDGGGLSVTMHKVSLCASFPSPLLSPSTEQILTPGIKILSSLTLKRQDQDFGVQDKGR